LGDNEIAVSFKLTVRKSQQLLGMSDVLIIHKTSQLKRRYLRNASADVRPTNKVLVHKLSDSIGWSNSIQQVCCNLLTKVVNWGQDWVQGADVPVYGFVSSLLEPDELRP
jgi:hypothetical protein